MKQYEELSIRDYFIFGKVCQDTQNSQVILKALLGRDISLKKSEIEHYMQEYKENKFIRLDLLATDEDGTVYNTEMQNESKNPTRQKELPFRSRYYQALIDSASLKEGIDYMDMPEVYIIFICTYDPFGLNLPLYTIRPSCVEANNMNYYDKSQKLFFNTTADLSSLPQSTQNMLKYIEEGNVNDENTRHLNKIVQNAIEKEIWKEDYMLTVVHDKDVFKDGYDSRQAEVDTLQIEIDALQDSVAQKDATIADKDAEIADMNAEIANLKAELEAARGRKKLNKEN